MGFLRTLFWIAITVVIVVFSFHNWTSVTVTLFGGMVADVKLPVLLVGAFLLGFLPLYAWHRFHRWTSRRRMAALDRPGAAIVPPPDDAALPMGSAMPTPAPPMPACPLPAPPAEAP